MAGSGLALYAYARRSLSPRGATVAAATYLVLPYHVLDLYQRGALAELLTFVWMPLAWIALEELFGIGGSPATGPEWRPRVRSVAGLAAAVGALFWSHPPTSFTFTLVTGVLALVLAARRRDLTGLGLAALAVALGLGLAGAYFYPAVVEQGFVRNDVFREHWAYADGYVLGPRPAHAHAPFWRAVNGTWLVSTLGIVACATLLLRRRAELSAPLRQKIALWSLAGVLVSLLMTPVARPLEPLIPGLAMTSFPWRMLCVATLALALLAGGLADSARAASGAGERHQARLLGGACVLVVGGSFLFSALWVAVPMAGAPAFVPRPDRPTANKYWVVPRWAPEDLRELPALDRATLARGFGSVDVRRWDPELRELDVQLAAADRLVVRTFDFPGWTARLDDRPATIARGTWGNIELDLPAGRHSVVLDLRGTTARRLGDAISLVALAAVGALLAASRRRWRVREVGQG
jgi:hypothetical protein